MDHDAVVFAQVMIVIVSTVAALVVIGGVGRILWRVGSRVRATPPASVAAGDVERLEHAVEAIAIEVERISESQRFTVALLSDRLPQRDSTERAGALGRPGALARANTPH